MSFAARFLIIIISAGLVTYYVGYLIWVVIQQRHCAKLDAVRSRLPFLRSTQAAADSGPHDTLWSYGNKISYVAPRQMWKWLESEGLVNEKEQRCS